MKHLEKKHNIKAEIGKNGQTDFNENHSAKTLTDTNHLVFLYRKESEINKKRQDVIKNKAKFLQKIKNLKINGQKDKLM